MSLKGRLAVVTGGTRGIGRAIVERLLTDSADVIATGRGAIGDVPEGARYEGVDCEVPEQVDAFSRRLTELKPDILINNAGFNKNLPFAEIEPSLFERIQRVNVHAPFRFSQAVLTGMRERKWGRIIGVNSIFGMISKEHRASYSASKFALDGMMAALAAEVAVDGILVNCVAPGFTETDMTRAALGEKGIAEMVAQVPIRRMAQPSEIATFVAWLAGPENTYISGQIIAIDGGFTRV
jgi:NAD(P)-dependent dehydrogenase (short-subunit alcohol dehydrogenase family)